MAMYFPGLNNRVALAGTAVEEERYVPALFFTQRLFQFTSNHHLKIFDGFRIRLKISRCVRWCQDCVYSLSIGLSNLANKLHEIGVRGLAQNLSMSCLSTHVFSLS